MLKPLDIAVLGWVRTVPGAMPWTQIEVASGLGVSQSSVHRAMRQLERSELLTKDPRPFRDLVVHAIRHVYPPSLGARARGLPTAWAHPVVAAHLQVSEALVWPYDEGGEVGPSLVPLHPCVPGAAERAPAFHELMAIIDVFRVGRVRDREVATERLEALLGGS